MSTNNVPSKPQFSLIESSILDNLKATVASITDTHDKDIEELWTNADKYYSNNFQNQLCSYLCWDCAH